MSSASAPLAFWSVNKIRAELKTHFGGEGFHLLHSGLSWSWPDVDKEIHLVVLSDAFPILFDPWFWPKGARVRISVLCRAHQRWLASLFGVSPKTIGMINLNAKPAPARRIPLGELREFVVAGRPAPQKRVFEALELALELKLRAEDPSARVLFLTPTEERFLPPPLRAGGELERRGVEIRTRVRLGWQKRLTKNSAFLRLSLDPSEDFGVSVMEARAQGATLVLSEWGAHFDSGARGAYFVSPEDVMSLLPSGSRPGFRIRKPIPRLKWRRFPMAKGHSGTALDSSEWRALAKRRGKLQLASVRSLLQVHLEGSMAAGASAVQAAGFLSTPP